MRRQGKVKAISYITFIVEVQKRSYNKSRGTLQRLSSTVLDAYIGEVKSVEVQLYGS